MTNASALSARWVGLAGAVAATIGSWGAGALSVKDPTADWPVLGLLRHGAGPRIALALVYGGVAALILGWLALGRAVRDGEDGTGQRALLATFAWWAAPFLLSVPLFTRDLWSYAAQAHLTAAGLDPYRAGPDQLPGPYLDEVQRVWVDSPAPYGPAWLLAGRWIANLAGNQVYVTAECMRLLSIVGVLLLVRYLPRLARLCGADPRIAIWLGLANPLLLLHFVSAGHNDALMVGLGVAGLVLVAEGRWVTGVAVATLGVAVKVPIALVLAFSVPMLARRLGGPNAWARATGAVAAVALATFALVTFVSGLGLGWLGQLGTPGIVVSWVSVPTGLALLGSYLGGLVGLGDYHDALVSAFRQAGLIVTAVLCLGLWVASCRRPERTVRALGLALLVLVAFSAIIQPWYLLWPIIVLCAVGLSARATTAIVALTTWMALVVTPQGAALYNHLTPVLVTSAAAIVTAVLFLGRSQRPAEEERPAVPITA